MQLPAEFEMKMKKLLGEEWDDFLTCYSNDKYQALRFNPLKVEKEDEEKLLGRLGIDPEPVPWAGHGYYYSAESHPGKHAWHECGLYYIQEPSAMSAAALLAPEPGMRVLDLCAAPGGKTTQLSSYLGREGLLIANEINAGRCRILSQNIERLGIPNCIVTNQDSASMSAHFPSYFHAILVDAPCSGEGMFRKIPEASQEWSPENVTLCAERQEEILDHAASMLMPGGRLVYSTCTFSPEENEMQIAGFLQRHPEFRVEKTEAPFFAPARPEWIPEETAEGDIRNMTADTFRLWPHKLHGEGHYAAVLRKKGSLQFVRILSNLPAEKEPDRKPDKKTLRKGSRTDDLFYGKKSKTSGKQKGGNGNKGGNDTLLEDFLSETMTDSARLFIRNGKLTTFGDQVYRLPDHAPALEGLRVLRAGLQIGAICKERFEPSHALALALSPKEVKNCLNLRLDDPRCNAFFRGETFDIHEEDFMNGEMPSKGWCLIAVEGYSAGWGKIAGGRLKNHYPKGLRTNLDVHM